MAALFAEKTQEKLIFYTRPLDPGALSERPAFFFIKR
jgi:hypothetical protein